VTQDWVHWKRSSQGGSEPLCLPKCEEYFDHLSDYHLGKKDSFPWIDQYVSHTKQVCSALTRLTRIPEEPGSVCGRQLTILTVISYLYSV
jgi:hypothetical protein